jgi:predicted aldo/keto reductase-like oxidoreductase
MRYRRLGRSELMVSVVGIGTTQLRRVPEKQAIETLRRAFELGVNHVNSGPDYEGADDLIAAALRETDPSREIYISYQTGGSLSDVERAFEAACEKFGRERLDLFGLAALAEQEAFGNDVWGSNGTLEFLRRKKEEGRLRALFASDHGSPEHMKEVLERDAFDVLMLAYNPLGFHIISFRPDTVWQIETPPVPLQKEYVWEDIPRTGAEILPLARGRDVGVMIMKPLAGGLLTSSKAFPPHPWREGLPEPLPAADVLRYLLMDPAVSCVVPGMASVQEVEENARAGSGEIRLDAARMDAVRSRASALAGTLCSRRGACDDSCSKGLPVSFIFRAAYHYLYPSAPFEVSSNLQYFKLHPSEQSLCETCADRTCRCPAGIDIPREMMAIHRKMLELRDRGLVPAVDGRPEDWASGRPYAAKVLGREIPTAGRVGEAATVRVHLRNIGTRTWHRDAGNGGGRITMVATVDGRQQATLPLRHDVWPGGQCHFAFGLELASAGQHDLQLELHDEAGSLSERGIPALRGVFRADGSPVPPRGWMERARSLLALRSR